MSRMKLTMTLQATESPAKLVESATKTPQVFIDTLQGLVQSALSHLPQLVVAVMVLIFFWLLGRIVRRMFNLASRRSGVDQRLRILTGRIIGILAVTIGVFSAFTVVIPSLRFSDIIAGLGFTSFIVGFATRDILNNLLSGVLILWRQPFQIGDYIFVKDKQGKVEYIGVRATTMRMDDGERILVPNGDMYSSALIVRNAGDPRRMKVALTVGYDADIERAKKAISEVLESSPDVKHDPSPQILVTDLTAEGVKLTVYFWIDSETGQPLQVFDSVATGLKNSLERSKIELFPALVPASELGLAKEDRRSEPVQEPREEI